jgi:predicted transposase YbfD/YdcC
MRFKENCQKKNELLSNFELLQLVKLKKIVIQINDLLAAYMAYVF